MSGIEPVLSGRPEGGRYVPVLVWRLPALVTVVSSAVLGGGVGTCAWVINASVPMSYARNDPAMHLREIAAHLDLRGPGVGLMTGVDVGHVVAREDEGVRLWATVGLGTPIQAAAESDFEAVHADAEKAGAARAGAARAGAARAGAARAGAARAGAAKDGVWEIGTVNIVAWVPEALVPGALVNAVATITEAKTQAIRDLGFEATGTATDAVCVLCPEGGESPAEYGGPRSTWGSRLARATYHAVRTGGGKQIRTWSDTVSGS